MHDIQKTSIYWREYNRLNLRYKRMIDDAIEVLKESPTEYQNKITRISKHKDGVLYRFRLPGCYIMYVVPEHAEGEKVMLTLLSVKNLRNN